MLKLHMRTMLLSTAFNTLETVLSNLHHAFVDTAERSFYYMKSLPANKQPSGSLLISEWAHISNADQSARIHRQSVKPWQPQDAGSRVGRLCTLSRQSMTRILFFHAHVDGMHVADESLAGLVEDMVNLSFLLMKRRRRSKLPYECVVTKAQNTW